MWFVGYGCFFIAIAIARLRLTNMCACGCTCQNIMNSQTGVPIKYKAIGHLKFFPKYGVATCNNRMALYS